MTHDTGAFSKIGLLIFLELQSKISFKSFFRKFGIPYHFCQTPGCDDITSMNQSIQVSSRLLNCLPHVIVAVKIEDVGDQVESILVVLNVGIEACQVESVGKVVFVDLAKVLIASR